MKALPPEPQVPKEVSENKYVQKAVLKSRGRKTLRRIRNIFLASATLSTGLQFAPDLVSSKFDDYMKAQGYTQTYSDHFHTGDIRVYDRYNPLYPFHLAGKSVAVTWDQAMRENHTSYFDLTLATPLIYGNTLWKGFTDMLPFGSDLDAYSITTNGAPEDRTNFIRPPGQFSLNSFLRDFSGVEGRALEFTSDRDELRDVLFQFVMLHEARHGDQNRAAFMTANESDADLYAFRVLSARGVDRTLLNEAANIVLHARALNATLAGDAGHASTFSMQRGGQRIFDAHQDAAAFDRLHTVLAEADRRNDANFAPDMPVGNRYLYLTMAMNNEGLLNEDPGLRKAAVAFVRSIEYFNNLSDGMIIDPGYDLSGLDLDYLTKPYTPVPDKLQPPPRPPGAGV